MIDNFSVYTHVHPSKENYNKDAEIKKFKNTFDNDFFYNPLHVRLRILYIIIILILLNINIRRAIL